MPAGSSPLVGSSRISSCGSASRQRATPRRWRMPIEYLETRSPPRVVRPTRASAGSIRERTSGPRAAATTRRFSRPDRCMWKRGSSTIAPTRRSASTRCAGTGRPSRDIEPALAWVSPSSVRIRVVLPAPFGPRNPNAQPRGTDRSTPSIAARSPKRLVRPRVSIAGADDRSSLGSAVGGIPLLPGFRGGTNLATARRQPQLGIAPSGPTSYARRYIALRSKEPGQPGERSYSKLTRWRWTAQRLSSWRLES